VIQVLLLALLTVYSIGSTIFFLRQAGKGFRKLELREILPHRAYSVEREPEQGTRPLTNMPSTEQITIASTVHFRQGQPVILINFTIVNESNENVVVDSLLYEISVGALGHPFESHRKKRIYFLKKAKIRAGAKYEISEDLIMPLETCQQLCSLASQDDSDIAWDMTAIAFLESAKSLVRIRSEQEQSTAYNHWKNWYNSWAEKGAG